jgi:REP element-mobilizing transposase RayT
MKINMIFNIEDEMDKQSFEDAMMGYKYKCWIEEFQEYLRKRLKYEELSERDYMTIEAVKDEFYRIRQEIMND